MSESIDTDKKSSTNTEKEELFDRELRLKAYKAKAKFGIFNAKIISNVVVFNRLYRSKGIHPGARYVFYGNILNSDVKGVLAYVKGAVTRTPAYNKDGDVIPDYTAVFSLKGT